jgi:hypothetical protein
MGYTTTESDGPLDEVFTGDRLNFFRSVRGGVQIRLKSEAVRFSECSMPENDRLDGCLNEIELGVVEREATPKLLMKLGIQLRLTGLSLSNTVSILEIFGVSRVRSTVHNWIHTAELRPEAGRSSDRVAVDESLIRLNDEQYGCMLLSIRIPTNCYI